MMRHRHRVRGYVVGGPVYQTPGSQWTLDELRQIAASLGVADEIRFTGHLADIPSVLRALDVLVHASTAPEPFGMAIAEGMACGRAVIAARSGGASELLEERLDALGHEPGNAVQLADALDELVSDGALRARLGDAARAAACRKFGADRMAAEFAKVYFG
jgi:glycosyltransferase involved in cell wall biosynthesis